MMRNKLLTAFLLGMIFTLVFGYTRDWTESTPTDSTVANQIDDYNRYLRVDTAERLEDYIGGFNASDSNEGFYHILYIEKSSTPSTPAAGKGMTYGKAVGGKCELFWIDEDGDEKQITSGGVLKISAGDFDANSIDEDDIQLANNAYLKAKNAAGTGTVDLVKAGTNDLPTLPDSAEMASSAAPTEDEGIANKKYVDDQIVAKTQSSVDEGTSDITNTTGDWADMANMSKTLTTTGGNVLVLFSATFYGTNNNDAEVRLDMGGTKSHTIRIDGADTTPNHAITLAFLFTSVSAAEHTFKVEWKDAAGTVTQNGATYKRVLNVIELPG